MAYGTAGQSLPFCSETEGADGDGEDDQESDHDILNIGVYAHHVERVSDHTPEQDTAKRSECISFSARHRRASDHYGADRLQFNAGAGTGLGCANAGEQEHRGNANKQSIDCEKDEFSTIDVDTGQVGGSGVVADRIDTSTKLCMRQNEMDNTVSG